MSAPIKHLLYTRLIRPGAQLLIWWPVFAFAAIPPCLVGLLLCRFPKESVGVFSLLLLLGLKLDRDYRAKQRSLAVLRYSIISPSIYKNKKNRSPGR